MNEIPNQPPLPAKPDPLVRAVRSLTVAVWCMAIGVLLLFGFFLTMSRQGWLTGEKVAWSAMR